MNLQQVNELLENSKCTCIILKNDKIIYRSALNGVRPLLLFLNENVSLDENDKLILIDKIIGRAAIFLAVKCRINKIFTPVISSEALKIAKLYNIEYEASITVPYIINREGTGKCPIEASVSSTIDLDEAITNIRHVVAELAKKPNK